MDSLPDGLVHLTFGDSFSCDMYDCVFPTRTARFGNALIDEGSLRLKQTRFKEDHRPIDDTCDCSTCKRYTRSFLHKIANKDVSGAQLLTVHNIAFQLRLMRRQRQAIIDGTYPQWVQQWISKSQPIPQGGAPVDPKTHSKRQEYSRDEVSIWRRCSSSRSFSSSLDFIILLVAGETNPQKKS